MRKRIVAGNWKMNTLRSDARTLVSEVLEGLETIENPPEVVFSPPYVTLGMVAGMVAGRTGVHVAAQNCANHESGAYTGEVSAAMIADTGADMVIIGHSERRQYYGEKGKILSDKVNLALKNGLTPVFCVGETLDERKSGRVEQVIGSQLDEGLFHLDADALENVVIAYEPVWAIGTGETASPEQAQEVHAFIRKTLSGRYDDALAGVVSILYGGSVKPGNAASIFAMPDIDGGLIGGASLKAPDFLEIIKAI